MVIGFIKASLLLKLCSLLLFLASPAYGDAIVGDLDVGGQISVGTPLAENYGGTGQTTAQTAINSLTNVSAAAAGYVLTKDPATGNAVFLLATDDSEWPLSISKGGTEHTTAQDAINALTNVSAAIDESVLTKDAISGNAIYKLLPTANDPATTVTEETTWAIPAAVGTGSNYARDDHTHGTPQDPETGHVTTYDHPGYDTHVAASNPHSGSAASGANSDITSLSGLTSVLSQSQGGTGGSTPQSAINALTQVAGAGAEHVLTKDTITGDAVFKPGVAPGGADTEVLINDGGGIGGATGFSVDNFTNTVTISGVLIIK